MSVGGYKIRDQQATHFLTLTVVGWVDIFTRACYAEIITDSLNYCVENRGLKIYSWCLMSNHLHIICRSENEDLSAIVRDFKKSTSRQILYEIKSNVQESRKDWMLSVFGKAGVDNPKNVKYQFWINGNHPIEIVSNRFIDQKTNYIHQNPVKAGLVQQPEYYRYSSAIDFTDEKGMVKLEQM